MSEIQVTTSDLHNSSENLNSAATQFGNVQAQISGAITNVGNVYEGKLRQALESILGGANQTAARLQNRAHDLGNELAVRASGFEAANNSGQAAVLGASTAYVNFIEQTSTLRLSTFFDKLKEKARLLAKISGLAIESFIALIFVPTIPGILTPFPETSSTAVTPPEKVSGFGQLMEKQEQAEKEAEATQWWLDVPTKSQQGLELNGKATAYGCAPTSTSMILDYWHGKDPANQTMSAQELVDVNAKQGKFSPTGMSASDVHDEVTSLGYSTVEDRTNSNLAELQAAVAEGPVIAIVKLGIKSSGTNHAVVITGISPDNQIQINDPWDGSAHTYSWDVFSKSWGANFGKDVPKNNFVIIRP